MPPQTRPRRTLLLLALAAAPHLVACSSDPSPSPKPTPTDVVLEGDATAAQLETFLQDKARDWAWAGGQFDSPDAEATLPTSPATTFAWHADPADFAQGGAAGDVQMTHLLTFGTPSNHQLLRVFTTLSDYTPDDVAWQKLIVAGEPITVALTTGTFVGTDLPDDGGPFIGQELPFTIE